MSVNFAPFASEIVTVKIAVIGRLAAINEFGSGVSIQSTTKMVVEYCDFWVVLWSTQNPLGEEILILSSSVMMMVIIIRMSAYKLAHIGVLTVR